MVLSSNRLLLVSMRVAGLVRVSKDRTVYEIPYSGGKNSMKMEGKIPPASKEALAEIMKGFGGKVTYEPDGLKLDIPNKKAVEAFDEVQDLFKLDKKLRSIFDLKKKSQYADDINEAVKQPADHARERSEKDEKAKAEKIKQKPQAPAQKAPEQQAPAEQQAPEKEAAKPGGSQPPGSSGRRRPGPPPKAKFLKSLDRMSQVVQQSDDQSEIVDAVEDFLDGIRYDSWPETG